MGKVKLQLLTTTEDTKDNVVSFTSGDTANPSTWKDVAALASNENHKSILNKISTMFNNVRYLYKILGSTDISALGTVTQAISTIKGNIGDMKGISSSAAITTQGQYALDAREKNASVDGTLANEINKLNSNLQNKGDKWSYSNNGFKTINTSGWTTILDNVSQYDILYFECIWNDNHYVTSMPVLVFKHLNSSNTPLLCIIKNEYFVRYIYDNTHDVAYAQASNSEITQARCCMAINL